MKESEVVIKEKWNHWGYEEGNKPLWILFSDDLGQPMEDQNEKNWIANQYVTILIAKTSGDKQVQISIRNLMDFQKSSYDKSYLNNKKQIKNLKTCQFYGES